MSSKFDCCAQKKVFELNWSGFVVRVCFRNDKISRTIEWALKYTRNHLRAMSVKNNWLFRAKEGFEAKMLWSKLWMHVVICTKEDFQLNNSITLNTCNHLQVVRYWVHVLKIVLWTCNYHVFLEKFDVTWKFYLIKQKNVSEDIINNSDRSHFSKIRSEFYIVCPKFIEGLSLLKTQPRIIKVYILTKSINKFNVVLPGNFP